MLKVSMKHKPTLIWISSMNLLSSSCLLNLSLSLSLSFSLSLSLSLSSLLFCIDRCDQGQENSDRVYCIDIYYCGISSPLLEVTMYTLELAEWSNKMYNTYWYPIYKYIYIHIHIHIHIQIHISTLRDITVHFRLLSEMEESTFRIEYKI